MFWASPSLSPFLDVSPRFSTLLHIFGPRGKGGVLRLLSILRIGGKPECNNDDEERFKRGWLPREPEGSVSNFYERRFKHWESARRRYPITVEKRAHYKHIRISALALYSSDIELVVRKEDSTSNRRLSSLNFYLSLSLSLSRSLEFYIFHLSFQAKQQIFKLRKKPKTLPYARNFQDLWKNINFA